MNDMRLNKAGAGVFIDGFEPAEARIEWARCAPTFRGWDYLL